MIILFQSSRKYKHKGTMQGLQRCDNEECLAALGTRPYLQVGKVRQVGKLCQISEIFCIYCN